MMRHRRNAPDPESSSEEDDAFSALSRKTKRPKTASASAKQPQGITSQPVVSGATERDDSSQLETNPPPRRQQQQQQQQPTGPSTLTSSMKRHHGALTGSRKAKMDALLEELQHAKPSAPRSQQQQQQKQQSKNARGSFVQPGEEHITTNLFVGNLAPSITEEQLTDLFSQFGDLYSVKIMWARTTEERSRNRHSGFVCFMNRQDAEDALNECDETDPFNVGRRIMVRWGRHVKKDRGSVAAVVKRPRPPRNNAIAAEKLRASLPPAKFDTTTKNRPRVQVVAPRDPRRALFIATVASFVAKDGSQLERRVMEREAHNPRFSFLRDPTNEQARQECIFYRWRVFSFLQGDGFHQWRTEPFVMLEPGGCLWVPPPVDTEAARRERMENERKAEEIRRQKEERRLHHTGRQLENKRRRGGAPERRLTREELAEFDCLFRQELCAARGSICRAMAFCFEKSGCWSQICDLLRELLLDKADAARELDVETKVAQLFLLSDVLFNSQQPGVRNAFRYRDAIEKMAPEVFASLGTRSQRLGRWTRNKLSTAVSAVLGAWTNWSVYNPMFLDELHATYEGREIPKTEDKPPPKLATDPEPKPEKEAEAPATGVVQKIRQGDWAVVEHEDDVAVSSVSETAVSRVEGKALSRRGDEKHVETEADGEPLDEEDLDGEPLEEEDADGEPLDEEDPDGEPLEEEDGDGEPLDDEDPDGEPLDE